VDTLTLVKAGQGFRGDDQPAGLGDRFKGGQKVASKLPETVTDDPQVRSVPARLSQRAIARCLLNYEMMFAYQIPSTPLIPKGSPGGALSAGEGVGSSCRSSQRVKSPAIADQ
jgi:hypothetical protein